MKQPLAVYQEVVEQYLEQCPDCRADLEDKYRQHPDATWHWALACPNHITTLRAVADLLEQYWCLDVALATKHRIEKGKKLLEDKTLSIGKIMQYTDAVHTLEQQLAPEHRGAVIETLQLQLDNIYTDMVSWLKSSK